MKKLTSVVTVLLMAVSMALAADPVVLVQRGTMEAGVASPGNQFGHDIEGQTSYHVFAGKAITKVENIGGVQSASLLVSKASWGAASGSCSMSPLYGFELAGDHLIWSTTGLASYSGSHSVWMADKTTGALTQLVTRTGISNYVGQTASTTSAQTAAPNGGLTFQEGATSSILNVDLNGTLTTVLESSVVATATGYSKIFSGLAYDNAGFLYWSHNDNDNVYRMLTDGTIEKVLDRASILALSGADGAVIGDIIAGGDNRMYFADNTSKSVFAFDPEKGDASLEWLATDASKAPTSLSWYNDGATDYLTYHTYTGDLMGIAIPEPMTLALLAAGGLGVVRKRRS